MGYVCYAVEVKKSLIYAAFRAWKTLRRYFISLPSKTAFYCVTKSREPTTNESDVFSVLVCTLFVSVDDKLVSILPYHRKAKDSRFLYHLKFDYTFLRFDESISFLIAVAAGEVYHPVCKRSNSNDNQTKKKTPKLPLFIPTFVF